MVSTLGVSDIHQTCEVVTGRTCLKCCVELSEYGLLFVYNWGLEEPLCCANFLFDHMIELLEEVLQIITKQCDCDWMSLLYVFALHCIILCNCVKYFHIR